MNPPGPKKIPGTPLSMNRRSAPGDSIPGRNSFGLPRTAGTTFFIRRTTGSSPAISVTSRAPLGMMSREASSSGSSFFMFSRTPRSMSRTPAEVCPGIIRTSKVAAHRPPTTFTAEPP